MKVLGKRVLIRQNKAPNTTSSGLFVPDAMVEKENNGVVVGVGPGVEEVSVGDTVLFGKYAGEDAGDGLLIVQEMDVFAKVVS